MALTGDAASGPMRIGVALTDVLAGVNGAVGVGAALAGRAATGRGTVVRTSLLAAAVSAHSFQGTKWTVSGEVARPTGNHHPQIAPYGSFRCRDGHLQIAVGSEGIWARLAPLIGLAPNDSRFAVNLSRVARRDELRAVIEHEFAHRDRDELLRDLGAAGVPTVRSAPSTRSTRGIRPLVRDWSWRSTMRSPAEFSCLGPLCVSSPPTVKRSCGAHIWLPLRSGNTPKRSSRGCMPPRVMATSLGNRSRR